MVLKDMVFTFCYINYILYVYFHHNLGNVHLGHSVYGKRPPYNLSSETSPHCQINQPRLPFWLSLI